MHVYYKLILFLLPTFLFAEGVVIDFDKSVFIQFLIFIIFGLIIQKLIVNPVVDIIDRREEATIGSKDASRDMLEEVEVMASDYETKLKEAKKQALLEQETTLKATSVNLGGVYQSEKSKIEEDLQAFSNKLEAEKQKVRKELDIESKQIATLIVKKIMG